MGSLGRPEGIRPYGDLEMSPGAERVHANKGGMIPGLQFFGTEEQGRVVQPQSMHLTRAEDLSQHRLIAAALQNAGFSGATFVAQGAGLGTSAAGPNIVNNQMQGVWGAKKAKDLAKELNLPESLWGDKIPLTDDDARTLRNFYTEYAKKYKTNLNETTTFLNPIGYSERIQQAIAVANAKALSSRGGGISEETYKKELKRVKQAFAGKTSAEEIQDGLIEEFIVDPETKKFRSNIPAFVIQGDDQDATRTSLQTGKNKKFTPRPVKGRTETRPALYEARSSARYGGGRWRGLSEALKNIIGLQSGGMIPGVPGLNKGALFLGMPHSFKSLTRSNEIKETLARTNILAQSGRSLDFPLMQTGSMVSGLGGRSSNIPGINGIYDMSDGRHVIKVHDTLESALAEARSSSLMRNVFGLESPQQEVIRVPHPDTGDLVFAVRSKYDEAFAQTTGSFEKESFSKQLIASLIRRDSDLSAENVYGNKVADVGAAIFGMDSSGKPRASMPRIIGEDPISVLEQLDINMLMKSGGGAKKHFAESTADIARSMTESEYVSSMKATISRARLNAEEAGSYLPGMSQLEKARYLKTLNNDFDNLDTVDWAEVYKHHTGIYPATKRPPTPASLKKKEEERVLRARQAGHNSPMINGMSFVNSGGMIPGMQYAIGGVVNQDRPFYGKYDQITTALYSRWVGAQSSEIAAIKTGVGSDAALAMAYGKGFRRS
jgi:hypothetical protein